MKKRTKIIINIVIGTMGFVLLVFGVSRNITPNFGNTISTVSPFNLNGINMLPRVSTWHLGSSAVRITKGWFTDLDATTANIGTLTIGSVTSGDLTVNGVAKVNIGSKAAPGFTFRTDTNTGMYELASDSLGFTVGSTGMLNLTSTTASISNSFYIASSNNVGIGQVAPGSKLSVNGGISAGTYSATAAPSNGMIISGNVGIGTTAPANKFEVSSSGGAYTGMGLRLTSAGSYAGIDFNSPSGLVGQFILSGSTFSSGAFGGNELVLANELASGTLHLAAIGTSGIIKFTTGGNTTGNETMRITSSGNLGIGTTSPETKFEVVGTASVSALYATGDVSALTFTDRTPIFEGDALVEINRIQGKDGEIDHSTLPEFVKVERQIPVYEKQLVTEPVFDEKTSKSIDQMVEKDIQTGTKIVTERNIGNMLSMDVRAIQQLDQRVVVLENAKTNPLLLGGSLDTKTDNSSGNYGLFGLFGLLGLVPWIMKKFN